MAFPADDTQPKLPSQFPKQYIVDFDDSADDLALAETAQWGGGRGGWGGGRGYGGGGGYRGGWGGGGYGGGGYGGGGYGGGEFSFLY